MKRISLLLILVFSIISLINYTGCTSNGSGSEDSDTPYYAVRGTISLPGSDKLNNGNCEIFARIGGEKKRVYSWPWYQGHDQKYIADIPAGNYDEIDIYIYDCFSDPAYAYHTTSAGLNVTGPGVTRDFTVAKPVTRNVSGTLILPDADVVNEGKYAIEFAGSRHAHSRHAWPSGHTLIYSVQMEEGTYDDINIEVSNDKGKDCYRYNTSSASLTVGSSDIANLDFNLEKIPYATVSGTISLPAGDEVNNRYYSIEFEGNPSHGYTYGTWFSGNSWSYSLELEADTYNTIHVSVYEDDSNELYRYRTNSAGIVVGSSDISNVDFTLEKIVVYTVSGTLHLPSGESMTDGNYRISFGGISSDGSRDDSWLTGDSQSFSVKLEPGRYNAVNITVSDDKGNKAYQYNGSSLKMVVGDSDISGFDFDLEKIIYHTVTGTIYLPGGEEITGGGYNYQLYTGDGIASGAWTGTDAQPYSIELPAGTYDFIYLSVFDDDNKAWYRYRSEAEGVTVGDSDLTGVDFTVEKVLYYPVSGTISLPGSTVLDEGYYTIAFSGPSYNSAYGAWTAGNNTQSFSLELEEGVYDYISIEIDNASRELLYLYKTRSADLKVSEPGVSGLNFTVVPPVYHTVSGTIYLPDEDIVDIGSYVIIFSGDNYVQSFNSWDSGGTQSFSVELPEGNYHMIQIYVFNASHTTIYSYAAYNYLTLSGSDISGLEYCLERTPDPDTYEPTDDSSAGATQIISNNPAQYHTIDSESDVDWYFIDATAGTTYTITAEGTGSLLNMNIYVNPASSPFYSFSLDDPVFVNCPLTGRYYIQLIPSGSTIGQYTLEISNE